MTGVPPVPPVPSKISVTPTPPKQGDTCTVCYDFAEGDPSPVHLRITWSSASGDDHEDIYPTEESPCVTVTVPSDAISVLIEDLTGGSADYSSSVSK